MLFTGSAGGSAGAMTFGTLLRQLRADADLTQEELAEAAKISPRSVSDLERGINLTARKETARLLADALGLTGTVRAEFEAAARGKPVQAQLEGTAGATRTLPRDIGSFTGRERELRALMDATAGGVKSGGVVGIHAIGGMAGIGKTAFAVHAAHTLAPRFPAGQIFLPLHGHTPGQRPVDPADALASLILTVGVSVAQIPPGLEARMALWRDWLAGKQLLLLLDDAADSEQVRPLLPGTAGSLVLITSRRHLTALEDTQVISLDTLAPDEAAHLLILLAGRPDLTADATPVADMVQLCGYLPLAIGMLARQLHHHPAWDPTDLAGDLAAARDRLTLMTAENLSVTAAFDMSYADLTESQRYAFRCLGLHPGTDIDAFAMAALSDTDVATARHHLETLYGQYLITEPARGRYRLHDLIREHARALATTDPPAASQAALRRLLDYYVQTVRAADRYLPRRIPVPARDVLSTEPRQVPPVHGPDEALACIAAERFNLHAAIGYAADHALPGHATAIPAAMHTYLRMSGHWDQTFAIHRIAVEAARQANDPLAQAGALTDLGEMQLMISDLQAATVSLSQAMDLFRKHSSRLGEAAALTLLGAVHRLTADYSTGLVSLTAALDIYRGLGDRLGEACALHFLGALQRMRSEYPAAAATLAQALGGYRTLGNRAGEANVLVDLALTQRELADYPGATASLTRALTLYRDVGARLGQANVVNQLGAVQYLRGDHQAAAASLREALDLHHELGNALGEANSLIYLGLAQQIPGDYPAAYTSLTQALALYRKIGNRHGEANALNELGALHCLNGDYESAHAFLDEALRQYREHGETLGVAEALNYMGDLLLATATPAAARTQHEQARALAEGLAAPLITARALEGIGRCYLRDGSSDMAAAALNEAFVIYQRVGSPRAADIQAILRDASGRSAQEPPSPV
jgi:tetratricopeptide (TPR) repeat protein/transcriptional regulator with XRE-family HTH domain